MQNGKIHGYLGVESINLIKDLRRQKAKVGHLSKGLILIICSNSQKIDNQWLLQDLSFKVKNEEELKPTKFC